MVPLVPELRKLLENRIPEARERAEEASRAILNAFAVNRPEPYPSMTSEQRKLRNALRAKARQLGGGSQTDGFEPLIEELAYQQWHRMVFARFLAENNLLMHPSGVPVTLQDCADLASEEGEVDAWAVAAKYASQMLPDIFRPEDPETQVRFTPEARQKLETLLNNLPSGTFIADDSLGWMYQFWQSRKKEQINNSEKKIGGADIAPVTQLFTEDYMVRFLLENTLGAWWTTHHPTSPLIKNWKYLHFRENGDPAVENFSGWPEKTAELTVLDPCCGSGHFLVMAYDMLLQMRMEEDKLSGAQAGDAILNDNIYGLEIDPRCTQIAIFNLSLTAWKRDGYRSLPEVNITCTGLPVKGLLSEWIDLAGEDIELKNALNYLYQQFLNAPDLGSLINPNASIDGPLFSLNYEIIQKALDKVICNKSLLAQENDLFGVAALNVLRASKFLIKKYHLVVTNVPYLTTFKQGSKLKDFCEKYHKDAKADLATVFIDRCRDFVLPGGTISLITPMNWLFLGIYKKFRQNFLEYLEWKIVALLGPKAFGTITGEIVKVSLVIIDKKIPSTGSRFLGINTLSAPTLLQKDGYLQNGLSSYYEQSSQSANPDSRIVLSVQSKGNYLGDYAIALMGHSAGDAIRFNRYFWEIYPISEKWEYLQSTVQQTIPYGGRSEIVFWENEQGEMYKLAESVKHLNHAAQNWLRGKPVWGKNGVCITQMGNLPATIYSGERYDCNCTAIIPKKEEYLGALWAYCSSSKFVKEVRNIDQSIKVPPHTLLKVPFDINYWTNFAEQQGIMPYPCSDDPTQWIFNGSFDKIKNKLHVIVCLVLGYRWPQQDICNLDSFVDKDGILCFPTVFGEGTAVERLHTVLADVHENNWSHLQLMELLSNSGSLCKNLEDWLIDDFFIQHCKLFKNRPFIWHIWDGRKDGFSALVNYHKLTKSNLERLIFTYLGDWINFQRGRRDYGEPGADGRLVAALKLQEKLKLILQGEPPYDIYVRWKPLHKQPIGWDPDLNDGVRLNIRPFVTAGVLRSKFTINWNKDRGKNPDGSDRLNDLHFTIAQKLEARRKAGV